MDKKGSRCPYMNFLNDTHQKDLGMGDIDLAILGASLGG